MLELLRDFELKAFGHALPFAVAWFYKPESISANLKFRVQGHGDGVTYECGEIPGVRIWFLISNLSPFKVEIDRMQIQVVYGSVIGEILHIQKHTLNASKESEFHVQGYLNEKQVAYIRKNLHQNFETKLYLTAYVNSKIHNFELTREVNTNNVRLLNCAL
jgi:hypothetical protein